MAFPLNRCNLLLKDLEESSFEEMDKGSRQRPPSILCTKGTQVLIAPELVLVIASMSGLVSSSK